MKPIKPIEVDVVGIHPRFARLLVIKIKLDAVPNERWRQLFLAVGLADEGAQEPMTIDGDAICATMADADLEHEVGRIEQRIRLVNARVILEKRLANEQPAEPTLRMSQAVRYEAFSPETRARMEEARMAATRMSGFFLSAQWDAAVVPCEAQPDKQRSAN